MDTPSRPSTPVLLLAELALVPLAFWPALRAANADDSPGGMLLVVLIGAAVASGLITLARRFFRPGGPGKPAQSAAISAVVHIALIWGLLTQSAPLAWLAIAPLAIGLLTVVKGVRSAT